MILERGKKNTPMRLVVYGPEGVGKSTFAAQFPRAVFIDTEGSTEDMDVARTPKPNSWTELMRHVDYYIHHPQELGTLIIDTADWAEKLCAEHICALKQVGGIEDLGYGKGYVYLKEEFGRLLNRLDQLKERGVHVVLTAHAQLRKVEQPDEMGSYDRWEMKLSKQTFPLVKEWASMILFANYKTFIVNVDGKGAQKGKNKATGSVRVMYTTHHACWDAKNRVGLPDEMPFDYAQIAHLVTDLQPALIPEFPTSSPAAAGASPQGEAKDQADAQPSPRGEGARRADEVSSPSLPPTLAALMAANNIVPFEIQAVVAQKGYYPADMPISAYDPNFVSAVLVAAWPQVEAAILDNRKTEKTPF